MACPLCAGDRIRPSWLGSVFHSGKEFPYVQCLSCNSLYCDPMPGEEVLAEMYGPRAKAYWEAGAGEDHSRDQPSVINVLRSLRPGVFIDYGCGNGSLLKKARELGWQALGVEFDPEMAAFVESQTCIKVVAKSSDYLAGSRRIADVLHLGDVLEHLTKLDQQMPEILDLVKPSGYVVATGPLEGNTTLFNLVLRSVRSVRRRWHRSEVPPRHVMLATAQGQRRLFQRFKLQEVDFCVSEVSWPAPHRLSLEELKSPRRVGLFLLSRLSQRISWLNRSRWGNRYFYVGSLSAEGAL